MSCRRRPSSPNGSIKRPEPDGSTLIPTQVPSSIAHRTQHNAFARGLGFAYRIGKNWVVRGGYGLYYNASQMNAYTIGAPIAILQSFRLSTRFRPSRRLTLSSPTAGTIAGAAPTPNKSIRCSLSSDGKYESVELRPGAGALGGSWAGCTVPGRERRFTSTGITITTRRSRALGPFRRGVPNQRFGVIRSVPMTWWKTTTALNVVLRQRLTRVCPCC